MPRLIKSILRTVTCIGIFLWRTENPFKPVKDVEWDKFTLEEKQKMLRFVDDYRTMTMLREIMDGTEQ